jgi:cysteine peptidase C11 family protein
MKTKTQKTKTRSAKVAKKTWTVAVYMAGDNNLDPNAYLDLKEMKRVGSTADINIVAQVDSASAGSKTTRYAITKGGAASLKNDAKQKLGNQNTGNPKSLIDFVTWVAANYPAQRYALVLWNHGQGWDDTDIFAGERSGDRRRPRSDGFRHAFFRTTVKKAAAAARPTGATSRAILIDDNSKDFLDNVEMQKVAKAAVAKFGGKIDLFGMDACLMNQLEVAYQLRKQAQFIVGSELTEPVDGWPYDKILGKLAKTPTLKASELASTIVDDYIECYKAEGGPVTQSAVDLAQIDAVAAAVDALGNALVAAMGDAAAKDAIQIARLKTQRFDDNLNANVDLRDFCERLDAAASLSTAVKSAAHAVGVALDKHVIKNGYLGAKVANAKGVSIYFPQDEISPLYPKHLDFAKENSWTKFLKAFLS